MEQLEPEFSKDNYPGCPLAHHLETSFILEIAENTRPAVDSMQISYPVSALIEIRQSAMEQSAPWRPWVQFGCIWIFVVVPTIILY